MSLKLWEIDDAIQALLDAHIDPDTGAFNDEAAVAALDQLEMERDAKALAVAAVIVGERTEGEAVAKAAKHLAERAQRHERRAARLQEYLRAHIPEGTRLRDDRVEISWRRSQAVVVTAEHEVPVEYFRVRSEVDKAGIKAALADGKEVPGAALETRTHLQVK